MRSFFRKFKDGLKNQTPTFRKAFEKIFSGAKLDSESLEELEDILYSADFGVETVEEIIAAIQNAYKSDKQIRSQAAAQIGATVLTDVLERAEGRVEIGNKHPRSHCFNRG